MKLLNEDQFAEMQTDLAELINSINSAKENFDAEKIQKGILSELKENLKKNSLFKSLDDEAFKLRENLRILKDTRVEFINCQKTREFKIWIFNLISFSFGFLSCFLIFKYVI